MSLFIVPQPMLEIGAVQSETYLTGMPFDLQCSITLDSTVDTAVSVTATWQMNGADLTDTVRITASQPQQPALNLLETTMLYSDLTPSAVLLTVGSMYVQPSCTQLNLGTMF